MSASPVNVTVTGAAGQIGYALLFRIASGQLLGPDVPVRLRLLEITPALKAAEGTAMELDDCAFPLLAGIDITDDAAGRLRRRQRGAARRRPAAHRRHGARRPARGQRRHLQAAGRGASTPAPPTTSASSSSATRPTPTRSSRSSHAPDVPAERFTAMTRLDHNRALSQLANKAGGHRVNDITRLTIWGNHSATQYPDIFHAEIGGKHGRRGRRRPGVARERLHPDRRQARRGDHRGARRLVGRVARRTRRSTTSTTGSTARPRATGPRRRSRPTARTASPRA